VTVEVEPARTRFVDEVKLPSRLPKLFHHPIHRREISADLPEVPHLAFGTGLRHHHLD
jgi:hypothetical protein